MAEVQPAALPVDPSDRIYSLDILRGLALLGMFVVHFHVNSREPGGIDDIVRTLIWRLVETKSHGIFALLFGAGFAIQLRRAEQRGAPFVGIYLRRLAVLAVLGAAAHAFFGFNVLLGYAVWAVPLLLIRHWSTRALLIAAVLSAMSVPLYSRAETAYLQLTGGPVAVATVVDARRAAGTIVIDALRAAEARESYFSLLGARLRHMAWFYAQPFSFMPGATLALFVSGLLLVRLRIVEQVNRHSRILAGLAVFGLLSWLAHNWVLGYAPLGILRDQWLAFTYVSAALVVLDRRPALSAHLAGVADAGRMALTNYLLQIAALDLLFRGYAVGLGHIRPIVGLVAAVACFLVEVRLSTIWLAHFRFGPAEWLWRSASYGRLQPIRRRVASKLRASAPV
jgi:uncharacterized protein